ncbi:MAG: tRNA (adenosine(37)-N6)-dimethylallyltransferase MiaA [Candidatus Paceibacterota bacterium]|jgi:tRNA dimethylallyltransferase
MEIIKPKIIVILGPTSSGKSDVAVSMAKKFNGEIISADSRQVYKGMDLGTGKITKKEMLGIPHYLLDVANPKTIFSVEKYKKLAEKKIEEILKKNKTPIICGGTGFYIDSIVKNILLPQVKPNKKLRKELENKTTEELYRTLQKLSPSRAQNIDSKNRVRLIRAIEIAKALGKVPEVKELPSKYEFILIGIDLPDEILKERIKIRLQKRLKAGMLKEVQKLKKDGVSWKRLESFGLEYRNCALFLQNKISKEQMIQNIEKESFQYVKRQRTWFRRNKNIKWFGNNKRDILNHLLK